MQQQDSNKSKTHRRSNASYLLQYAGLGMQLLVVLGLAVWAGSKADDWLHLNFPLLAWLLPVLALAGMLYSVWKQTGKKQE